MDWVRTSHQSITACDTGSRLYGALHSVCTEASVCKEYCRANYPSAQFAEFWPNNGDDGECWCNCYSDCNDIRCVATGTCSTSICEENTRFDCKAYGNDIEIFEWKIPPPGKFRK